MKKVMATLLLVTAVLVQASSVGASVTWKGLTWTTYGSSTTAVVNGNGGLDITVLGGQSGDPGNDNWVLHSLLPGNLIQANAPWVEFRIQDTYAGDVSVGGPRGFVDTDMNGWTTESMWQGGVNAGRSRYYLNHNVYDANNGGWDNDPNNWWYTDLNTRSTGEHTIKFGMGVSGNVDMWFDGTLGMTILANANCPLFKRMYLGVSTAPGTTFTATYNDLRWGTGYVNYVPEPSSVAALMGGLISLIGTRRRKA